MNTAAPMARVWITSCKSMKNHLTVNANFISYKMYGNILKDKNQFIEW